MDWESCRDALADFSPTEQEILTEVYLYGDTIPDNVYSAAKERRIPQDIIWSMVNKLERGIAKRRGLL